MVKEKSRDFVERWRRVSMKIMDVLGKNFF
jgi:hypothetical protein